MTRDWGHEARLQCAERRRRVLAQPAIAQRLTERPLSYSRPDQWTGYVPPSVWNGEHNDSPLRAALIDILNAVAEAERAEPETDVEVF